MGIIEQMLTKYFISCKEDVYNAMRNVRTMTLPNLYASKIHAFLFRAWKERVKGRDWFDFEWYVKNNVSLNLEHLFHRIRHFGNLQQNALTKEYLQELLLARILELDIQKAIDDIKKLYQKSRRAKNLG